MAPGCFARSDAIGAAWGGLSNGACFVLPAQPASSAASSSSGMPAVAAARIAALLDSDAVSLVLRNLADRWGVIAKTFHWVIAGLIVLQYVLAKQAHDLPFGLQKLVVLARHKSFGITILALAILRLLWRLANRTPELPANMKPWERAAAHTSHWALYAILFAMPITGWLMSSARNYPVSWFNLVQLPDFVGQNDAIYDAMLTTHHVLAKVLFAVALVHILAALWHHFIRKDNVLRTMAPFARPR